YTHFPCAPLLHSSVEHEVVVATSMDDRITPAITDEDRDLALRLTGYADAAPVQTEPFSEWVISGQFPAGRPDWEPAGVRFVDDVGPHELRSEEHTSELQSRFDLVCRLLLE